MSHFCEGNGWWHEHKKNYFCAIFGGLRQKNKKKFEDVNAEKDVGLKFQRYFIYCKISKE